jgi:hypothetical protein
VEWVRERLVREDIWMLSTGRDLEVFNFVKLIF